MKHSASLAPLTVLCRNYITSNHLDVRRAGQVNNSVVAVGIHQPFPTKST
jgi:hypothetical protein